MMKTFQVTIPCQDDKQEALFDLFTNSGRLQERLSMIAEIEKLCTCEPRKKYSCSCDVYVRDLLKALEGNK